jgi:pyruvate formate lyase activating enzyme
VPGFNDTDEEIAGLTEFVAGVSPDIPWHVTAFHQDYRMQDAANTGAHQLLRAARIGRRAGLRYVYAGNLPGDVDGFENTACASCGATLIARSGYRIRSYHVTPDGRCPGCHTALPGRWDHAYTGQITSHPLAVWR